MDTVPYGLTGFDPDPGLVRSESVLVNRWMAHIYFFDRTEPGGHANSWIQIQKKDVPGITYNQCSGFVTFWYGSRCGSGSLDPYL